MAPAYSPPTRSPLQSVGDPGAALVAVPCSETLCSHLSSALLCCGALQTPQKSPSASARQRKSFRTASVSPTVFRPTPHQFIRDPFAAIDTEASLAKPRDAGIWHSTHTSSSHLTSTGPGLGLVCQYTRVDTLSSTESVKHCGATAALALHHSLASSIATKSRRRPLRSRSRPHHSPGRPPGRARLSSSRRQPPSPARPLSEPLSLTASSALVSSLALHGFLGKILGQASTGQFLHLLLSAHRNTLIRPPTRTNLDRLVSPARSAGIHGQHGGLHEH
jgi:hypothetical protein